jgi:CRISP-associated protein Cas1
MAITPGGQSSPWHPHGVRNAPAQRTEAPFWVVEQRAAAGVQDASIKTLEKSVHHFDAWEKAMQQAYSALTRLDKNPPKNVTELRALEANAAAAYFRAWKGVPIKWRGTSRRPIPEAWKAIEQRTSPFQLSGNRNAVQPVNAISNYAYAVLQSQVQIGAVAEGYDPTVGIMHEKHDGSAAFVFDLMEPERPVVGRKVLEFVAGHVFDPADFVIRSDGVCRPAENNDLSEECGELLEAAMQPCPATV